MSDETAYLIHRAEFLRSAPTVKILGECEGPEAAFIGRSNVGKSSLLNAVVHRKDLFRVSKTPGRTRSLNLFEVEAEHRPQGPAGDKRVFHFVDLPGYGYAKMSKAMMAEIGAFVGTYLETRPCLAVVCQLFDLRHTPSADDRRIFDLLQGGDFEHLIVATKADRLPKNQRNKAHRKLAQALQVSEDDLILSSAETRLGRDKLWSRLWAIMAASAS
jgi:GTP-binding protein